MSYQIQTSNPFDTVCRKVLEDFSMRVPEPKIDTYGATLRALESDFNRAGVRTTFPELYGLGPITHDLASPPNIVATFRKQECDLPTAVITPCADGVAMPLNSETFTIDAFATVGGAYKWSCDEINEVCDTAWKSHMANPNAWRETALDRLERSAIRELNQNAIDALEAVATDSEITVNVITTEGQPITAALNAILQYMAQTYGVEESDLIMIGGARVLQLLNAFRQAKGVNQDGIFNSLPSGVRMIYDPQIATDPVNSKALYVLPRGLLQVYYNYQYAGCNAIRFEKERRFILNARGRNWDFWSTVNTTTNCPDINFNMGLSKQHTFCSPPPSMFCDGSPIVKFELGCGPADCYDGLICPPAV